MQVYNGPAEVGEVTLLSTGFGLTVIVEHDSEEADGRDIIGAVCRSRQSVEISKDAGKPHH
jgi:hypothetical protein